MEEIVMMDFLQDHLVVAVGGVLLCIAVLLAVVSGLGAVFAFVKVLFMAVFGYSIPFWNRPIENDWIRVPPGWMIMAAQAPIIILYSLFG
jgi:hypothetical protein